MLAAVGCGDPKATLPPVHLNIDAGVYFLPECPYYAKINKRILLALPTAQEAELSGYRPAGCSKAVLPARLQAEKRIFGEIKPSSDTERRQAELLARSELRDIKNQQDDIESKQEEIDRKIDDATIINKY